MSAVPPPVNVLGVVASAVALNIDARKTPVDAEAAAAMLTWLRERPEIGDLRGVFDVVSELIVVAKLATTSTHGGIRAAARMALEHCGIDPWVAELEAGAHMRVAAASAAEPSHAGAV